MPLKKLQFAPGINKETTRYASEGGWYDCDKVRFRQGFPEKIGGWQAVSYNEYLGVCRNLYQWSALNGILYKAVGTNLKYYIELGGVYHDITPIRLTTGAGDATFDITDGSEIITVNEVAHGAVPGDFVTFSGAETLGTSVITASVLNDEFQIQSVVGDDSFTIIATDEGGNTIFANQTVSGGGGASTVAEYQISSGNEITNVLSGWGSGNYSFGPWSFISPDDSEFRARIWDQYAFGEDLVFGARRGALYYWDLSTGLSNRAVPVSSLAGASDVPLEQNLLFVADVSRFVFVFGTNPVGSSDFDPMLVRWSDQENLVDWTPSATNQSGSLRLSRGNTIEAVTQARQEILVWTDTSMYSFQYLGPPDVWGAQIVGQNTTIASQNAIASVGGAVFWMGREEFFVYSGNAQPLPCTLRRYVFNDININQRDQIFSGTNQKFNEVWWFYPTKDSTTVNRYVVFNYVENVWYHGNLARTSWFEGDEVYALTYNNRMVIHEVGSDDLETSTPTPIASSILSSDIDIDDGDRFSFIRRLIPDVAFDGSSVENPWVSFEIKALRFPGSGYKDPASEGGVNSGNVTKTVSAEVEQYTDQIFIRVRGRQLVLQLSSSDLGVDWQMGAPRIDIRQDGRK